MDPKEAINRFEELSIVNMGEVLAGELSKEQKWEGRDGEVDYILTRQPLLSGSESGRQLCHLWLKGPEDGRDRIVKKVNDALGISSPEDKAEKEDITKDSGNKKHITESARQVGIDSNYEEIATWIIQPENQKDDKDSL